MYLGCAQKSVEPTIYSYSLYANEPLPEHTIGGFPRNLVKEKSLSNSWRSGWSKYRSLSGREGLEPIRGGSTDLPTTPGTPFKTSHVVLSPFSNAYVAFPPLIAEEFNAKNDKQHEQ